MKNLLKITLILFGLMTVACAKDVSKTGPDGLAPRTPPTAVRGDTFLAFANHGEGEEDSITVIVVGRDMDVEFPETIQGNETDSGLIKIKLNSSEVCHYTRSPYTLVYTRSATCQTTVNVKRNDFLSVEDMRIGQTVSFWADYTYYQ